MDLKTIVQATVEGSRSAIGVGISCIIIGVIIGSVNMTSLGLNFGNLILRVVGDGHLFLGGLMVMIMSIILGMGVPGVAAYVIVYVVAVPVLRGVGATEMAANMFCLIYACLSNITPPVAMSSYVAAGIADSNMTKTSLIAMKLGVAGFILPFFFLNNPVLLYGSTEGVALGETIRAFCDGDARCARDCGGAFRSADAEIQRQRDDAAPCDPRDAGRGRIALCQPDAFDRRGGACAHRGRGRDRPRGAPEGSAPDAAEGRRGREPLPIDPDAEGKQSAFPINKKA